MADDAPDQALPGDESVGEANTTAQEPSTADDGATVTDITDIPRVPLGDGSGRTVWDKDSARLAGLKSAQMRKQKALTRAQRTEAEKKLEREIRKHVNEMSKIEVYHTYLSELQDDRPLSEWAEAAARKVLGGILTGEIDVKGSNAANVLDSVFKIIQLSQGKPTSIEGGDMTREERKDAIALLRDVVKQRQTAG